MMLPARRQLLVGGALLAVATPVMASQAQPFAWWKGTAASELGLTTAQTSRIEQIFETTRPELLQEWEELDRQEDKLSRLIRKDVSEAEIARQITRVEMARSSVNQTRSLMFVRMRKVLTPEQRQTLRAIEERRAAGRRPGASDAPRTPGSKPQGSDPRRRPEF